MKRHTQTLYRSYFIELAQDLDACWHVIAVTHCFLSNSLRPPGFLYPDMGTAERYARLAVDAYLDGRGA